MVSFGLHSYLVLQHFTLKYGLSHEKSICNVSATFNCDAVAMSPYSSIFGMPLALWGSSTHLIMLALIIGAGLGLSQPEGRLLRFSQALSGFILLMTVVMAGISMAFMKVFCLFCIGTYVASILLFLALILIQKFSFSEFTKDISSLGSSHRWVFGLFCAIPAFSVFGHAVLKNHFGGDRFKYMVAESIQNWESASAVAFDLNKGLSYSIGKEDAPIVIVEFADFLCPHCKVAAPTLHGFVSSRPDTRLIYKPFPLDGSCNTGIPHAGDGLRCQLAYFVMCAEKVGKKGWEAHEWAFEHQDSHSLEGWKSGFSELVKKLGLSDTEMDACLKSPETQSLVSDMVKEGIAGKIRGTPAVFVNGKLLEAGQIFEVLSSTYEHIRKK